MSLITLDPNNGSSPLTPITLTRGTSNNNSVTVPTSDEYTFVGWYLDAVSSSYISPVESVMVYDENGKSVQSTLPWSGNLFDSLLDIQIHTLEHFP